MKYMHLVIVASALMAVPGVAQSEEKATTATASAQASAPAPTVERNAMIFSADGRRIGRVDHVRSSGGNAAVASVIFGSHFINVPVSTLTPRDGGFVSSLKAADIIR